MRSFLRCCFLVASMLLAFIAGALWSKGHVAQAESDLSPMVSAWGQQVTVYYSAQRKLYVYTELGGNCVYAYTLTTPGGPLVRENCK